MNPEAQVRLDNILRKSPQSLTKEEADFLRARKSYLKPYHLEEYESVLNQTSQKETIKSKDAKLQKTN